MANFNKIDLAWREKELERIEHLSNYNLLCESFYSYPNYETSYGEALDKEEFTFHYIQETLEKRLIDIGFINSSLDNQNYN